MAKRLLAVTILLAAGCSAAPEPPPVARLAYQHPMVTLDPYAHDDGVTGSILAAVYETLMTISPGAGAQPLLADRWTTPDDTTWRLRLRRDVLFHDGSPLTTGDVVASIKRARHAEESALATYMEALEDVRAVAEPEPVVEITTRGPFPLLLNRLAMIPVTPRGVDPRHPVGTGPYTWVAGSEDGQIRLRRWERYWGARPDAGEIHIQFVEDDEELGRLIEGEQIDLMASVTEEFIRRQELDDRWHVVQVPTVATTMLGINMSGGLLADARVREAIDLAIDRAGLVASAYPGGSARPALTLIPAGVVGFAPGERVIGSDVERARELLGAAGLEPGARVRLDYSGVVRPAIDYLGDSLGAIGLRVDLTTHPYESFYRRIEEGQNELFVFGWNFVHLDASDFLGAVVHSLDGGHRQGGLNGARYSSSDVDRWIEEAAREPRSSLRLQLLRRALARVDQDRAYLPLYHLSRLALVRDPFRVEPTSGRWIAPHEVRRSD